MKTPRISAALGMGIALMAGVMVMASCSPRQMQSEYPREAQRISKILVMSFYDISRFYDLNINVRCYLCGLVMTTGSVPDSAGHYLTSQLIAQMEKQEGYTILSSEGSQDLLSGLLSGLDNAAADSALKLYTDAGKRAGADAVLIGHIFRFHERMGNRVSVQTPASVAFDLHLIHVASGRIVWTGHFDETQRPLSDNLLELNTFIKRGGSWITAEELALGGLEDMIRRFPKP